MSKKKKRWPKWIFAARSGVVVACTTISYTIIAWAMDMIKITPKLIILGLLSGFVWFLAEYRRVYKINLPANMNIESRHGCYTLILPKI